MFIVGLLFTVPLSAQQRVDSNPYIDVIRYSHPTGTKILSKIRVECLRRLGSGLLYGAYPLAVDIGPNTPINIVIKMNGVFGENCVTALNLGRDRVREHLNTPYVIDPMKTYSQIIPCSTSSPLDPHLITIYIDVIPPPAIDQK